ncbi:MAG: leucine-rich repeat domain-containing protein [Bacillota bacterium]|jgi:Leucine-rich repeat (LRR) protein
MKNKVKLFNQIITIICGLAIGICCFIHQIPVWATDNAEEIKFTDPKFEKAVRQQWKALQEGHLTRDKLKKLTSLRVNGLDITSIKGISALENLQELELNNNRISDISELENLKNLRQISLNNNNITDISPLSKLNHLWHISLAGNPLQDISPLAKIERPLNEEQFQFNIDLDLSRTGITDLSGLAGLKNLGTLNISDNPLKDISVMGVFTNLETLYMENTPVKDITSLSSCKKLEYLYLANNEIEDISPLKGLNQIKYLYFLNNKVKDLTPLQSMVKLDVADFSYNPVKVIPSLKNLNYLRYLILRDCKIKETQWLAQLPKNGAIHLDISFNLMDKKAVDQLANDIFKQNKLTWTYLPQVTSPDSPLSWSKKGIQNLKATGFLMNEEFWQDLRKPITQEEFTHLLNQLADKTGKDYTVKEMENPKHLLTRYEGAFLIAKGIEKILGKQLPYNHKNTFEDIDSVQKYREDYIIYLQEQGIMNGVSPKKFDPDGAFTREIALTVIDRLLSTNTD